MEGQDQSKRILCRAHEIGRNETSQAKMEFSWGSGTCIQDERAPPPPPPWNTGTCEHLPPSASPASSSFNAESANNFKERAGERDDRRIRYAAAAAAAPYVTRHPRFFRGDPSARGARSSRLHISKWKISLWREEGYGTTCDLVLTVGGREVAHINHLHE